MKIALLTLTPVHNYGGILQTIALYSYLENLGHDVTLINKKFYVPLWKNIIFKILEKLPFQNIKNKNKEARMAKQFKPFIEKYLPKQSIPIITQENLKKLIEIERFDAVIVGSDQVWRYQYINDGFYSIYFLDFEIDFSIKKIAYAASFGKDIWEVPDDTLKIAKLLKRFDAISTREKDGVELCKNIFGVADAQCALDPTMLVETEFYDQFFNGFRKDVGKKTLVIYVLDKSIEKRKIIDSLKNKLEEEGDIYQQINLYEIKQDQFYSVEEWLWQIKSADFVVVDSFHGMVFSILFKKQFIVLGNADRGLSRFSNLLGKLGLSSRLLSSNMPIDALLNETINYEDIDEKIKQLRAKSRAFLLRSLA